MSRRAPEAPRSPTPTGSMRAAVLEAPGSPLHIETIPIPAPRAGEVLVRVAACGLCHSDLHVMKGELRFPTPAVLGHEVSGTVAALGPGLESPPVGTPVAASFIMPCGSCRFCVEGRDELCQRFYELNRLKGVLYDGETRLFRHGGDPLWMYSMGGLAEYCVVPATDVFALPAELPLVESSILGCSLLTAYGAVRHGADLRCGDRVAVVATGGVGSNVIQLARAFGAAQIVAVDVRREKLAAALELGATDAVDAAAEDPVARVRELTAGHGVDVAFEVLGTPATFAQALAMVRPGGRMVAVGLAALDAAAPVEITPLVRRAVSIVGSYGGRTRTDMPAILSLAASGLARPERVVTRRYSLEEAHDAFRDLERGEIVGRAVVVL